MSFFELVGDDKSNYTSYDILTLPKSQLRSRKKNEYSSACPICGGDDRFRYWPDVGNFWCRQCDLRGFVIDAPEEHRQPLLREIIESKITSRTPEFVRWQVYHQELLDSIEGQMYWMTALGPDYTDAIYEFKLGWTVHPMLGESAVIPIQFGGKIILVKHRLVQKDNSKYMTEPSGLGAMLFGLDLALPYDKVIVAEGEKKAIRLWLAGYPAVSATNGANGFYSYPNWRLFFDNKECIVIFDPDEEGQKQANFTAGLLKGTNVTLPGKVDDVINDGFDIEKVLGTPWR